MSDNKSSQLHDYEIPIEDSNKLDILKKLGSGAFGEIFLGKNIKLNEDVAIKLESTRTENPNYLTKLKYI